ncbi:transcription repressor NadR [Alkaliphilus sp. B6464]|uniref:transcription repressor NadR n=1 Tax=Alkaliphilus sp. B6464 TaxID=2731219 RepID=UPI001BAB58A5|nr:transcription repressor NadR [Alkaliphilus sp. B6464]QUH19378.1 transcription repressor NadR [Alkaliphilus sp. B6464]
MTSTERRNAIINKLKNNVEPIKGTDLAKFFNISRQVIVQDIALLRAQGEDIIATPQGYMIPIKKDNRITKRIVCKHEGYNAIEEELQIMIDYGATIIDVIVEHPLYGEITSVLNINHKRDLEYFINTITKKKAEPLATLTDGIHIHTIEVANEEIFQELKKALNKKGYLIND